MNFRPREDPFFGDNFFRFGLIAINFSHTSFQPKGRFLSIWSLIYLFIYLFHVIDSFHTSVVILESES